MTTCTICADQLTDNLSALPCRHAFHHDCIQAWFRQKPSCPNCNAHFNRNSIVGPLFLDDARLLQSSKIQATNLDQRSDTDHIALAQSNSKIAQLQRDNMELMQKVRYLKSLRTILEAEARIQNMDTQVRMQRWRDMDSEQLASLLEIATQKTKSAQEDLMQAQRENANLRTNVDEWKREKEFFESRYDRLRKTMKDAQKRKPRRSNTGIPSGSVVTGSSSKQGSQTTVVDDSDESTDDEISTRRVVPKIHSSGDSARKRNMLLPFGVSSSSRTSIKRTLSTSHPGEHLETGDVAGVKRRREEEEEEEERENHDHEDSTTDDGLDIPGDNRNEDIDDSEDSSLDDIEIVPSRIESRPRHTVHSPSPPIIDLLSDDE